MADDLLNSRKYQLLKNPIHAFSFGFGAGFLPKAPGTWGTLVALPFFLFMQNYNTQIYLFMLLFLTLFSIFACGYTSTALGVHDHESIVCDEVVGYLLVLCFIPNSAIWIVAAFLVFRLFDIFKPWPICWFDKNISGGFGIVLDDIVAAVFSIAFLILIKYFL
ncbi:MAG: phosphatidylglycerophosphatase A [Pseudomonadota bacterium]|nr:phosphatidylglycerophosphatase A [Pseudomonadota bacterium]